MKAISVLQPWASLLMSGAKRVETRSWSTRHRGPLLIAASRGFPAELQAMCCGEPFAPVLARITGYLDPGSLPRGAILGLVDLLDCVPVESLQLDPGEAAFGDFRPGRYAWLCAHPQPLKAPIPWRGSLGLYEVPDIVFPRESSFNRYTLVDENAGRRVPPR